MILYLFNCLTKDPYTCIYRYSHQIFHIFNYLLKKGELIIHVCVWNECRASKPSVSSSGLEALQRTIGTYNRTEGSFEDFYAGQAELLLKCIAELFIAAIRATLNSANHSGIDRGAGSGKTRAAGQGRRTARDEAAKFDAFLAEFKARADAGRAGTELAVRKTDFAITDSQNDRRDVDAETRDAAARDDVSKRIAREQRSEDECGILTRKQVNEVLAENARLKEKIDSNRY